MAVEKVHLISILVIIRTDWEVAMHTVGIWELDLYNTLDHLLLHEVEHEDIRLEQLGVEDVDANCVDVDKTEVHHWVWEVVVRPSQAVQADVVVEVVAVVELVFVKNAQIVLAVVEVWDAK